MSSSVIPLRLPGNDITKLKKGDLQNFLEAGYPIVAADDLYDRNMTKIDKYSYIAKFVEKNAATKKQLLKESLINTTTTTDNTKVMAQYISVVKPSIIITSTPKLYVGEESKVLANSNDLYVNGADIDYRNLTFEFEIKDNATGASPKYEAIIYVDRNADGRFAHGELIRSYPNLSVGSYKKTISLDTDYLGAIPWKIAIYNEANNGIRTEKIGISAIRKDKEEKENIRILQIMNEDRFDKYGNKIPNLNLAIEENFIKYTKNLNDYNLNIDVKTKEEIEALFKEIPFDTSSATKKADTDIFYKNYDMLIFGFQDMYETLSDDYGAIQNVEYFMNQGMSVLFTHDVTSYNNKATTPNKYGYTFNKFFRGYLSMDRFGARIKMGHDLKFTDMSQARDTAWTPSGGEYSSIHGYSTAALWRMGNLLKSNNPNTIYKGIDYYSGTEYTDSKLPTTQVGRINEGQLTSYPYAIKETFTCAETHAQYYQLDLEDKEVTVWYTLEKDASTKSNIYGKSPLDASNNYYIYNKGNVTYSGVGHSKIENDMETKLFVNTMIAAYNAGVRPPTIEVLNQEAIPAKDGYILYLNEDFNKDNAIEYGATDYLVIEFKPLEKSLLSEDMGSTVGFMDLTGADLTDPNLTNPVISLKDGGPVAINFADVDGNMIPSVKSGRTYTIKYPLRLLNGTNSRKIVISAENGEHKIGYTTVTIIRRSLFDLD